MELLDRLKVADRVQVQKVHRQMPSGRLDKAIDKAPAIIITLASVHDKFTVLRARKGLQGTLLGLDEDLTPAQQAQKRAAWAFVHVHSICCSTRLTICEQQPVSTHMPRGWRSHELRRCAFCWGFQCKDRHKHWLHWLQSTSRCAANAIGHWGHLAQRYAGAPEPRHRHGWLASWIPGSLQNYWAVHPQWPHTKRHIRGVHMPI